MTKKTKELLLSLLLGVCIFLSACGQKDPEGPSSAAPSSVDPSSEEPSPSPAPLQLKDVLNPDGTINQEKYYQYFGIEVPEIDTSQEVPENVIRLGAVSSDYEKIYRQVNGFNQAQSDYKVEIQRYNSKDAMFLDLLRGQGCDLLALSPTDLTILSEKGGLEDLGPYLEKSEKVNREDMFEGVLAAGTAGETLVGIMPAFNVNMILVEKGYTRDGGWTIEEYLALMDKYPDVPLSASADPQLIVVWLTSALSALTESFVNWEERTCSFESEAFIQTLEMLNSYAQRCQKVRIDSPSFLTSHADRLYKRQVQTEMITFEFSEYFEQYSDIKDAFLGAYELAGIPNVEGAVRYTITDSLTGSENVLYSMNAASAKKDGAWLFLEYLLSEYQETMTKTVRSEGFPARRDLVERLLQEEVEAEVTNKDFTQNIYTGEMVPKRGRFTEEDKEHVLYILDHAAPPTELSNATFRNILLDDLQAFFAGDKTAAETAHLIQSRVSLYLDVN